MPQGFPRCHDQVAVPNMIARHALDLVELVVSELGGSIVCIVSIGPFGSSLQVKYSVRSQNPLHFNLVAEHIVSSTAIRLPWLMKPAASSRSSHAVSLKHRFASRRR